MSRPREPRWSFDELDRHLTRRGHETREEKLRALGIPDRTWWRWRRYGVPDRGADAAAIHLGTHPALIWPGWDSPPPPPPEPAPLELSDEWRTVVGLLRVELEWADAG